MLPVLILAQTQKLLGRGDVVKFIEAMPSRKLDANQEEELSAEEYSDTAGPNFFEVLRHDCRVGGSFSRVKMTNAHSSAKE